MGNESMTAEMTNSAGSMEDKGEEIYRKYNENRQEKKIRTSVLMWELEIS